MTNRDQDARHGLGRALCSTLVDLDPGPSTDTDIDAIVAAARIERLDAVLAHQVTAGDGGGVWSPAARGDLRQHLLQHVILCTVRERALVPLLEAFAGARVDLLLLKGVGLAYTVYAAPHLRPRDDTDLLVRREDLDRADRVLTACGYARVPEPDTELASTQRHYAQVDEAGVRHLVDLHWRIAIPRCFSEALAFADLWPRAVRVPALGAAARTLEMADALLLACIHRVAHHHDAPDLLWVWDIHLLAARLSSDQRAAFVDRAARAGMCAVCRRGLTLARDWFAAPVDGLIAALEVARADRHEPAARFLGGLRPMEVLRADVAALDGWRERWQLLCEHLFPPAAYMRATYGADRWLPTIYARRIVRGAPAWWRRPAAQ
jgi:hypothetical protein